MFAASTIILFTSVADGDATLARQIENIGYHVVRLRDQARLVEEIHSRQPSLVIVSGVNGEKNGTLQVVKRIRVQSPLLPILLIVRESSEALAIGALKAGASDYFKMPVIHEEFKQSIETRIKSSQGYTCRLTPMPSDGDRNCPTIIGESAAMLKLKDYIAKVAATDSTVLVTGETGTGKELVAETLHLLSQRRPNPFISVNCAAIPEGLVESELFGHHRGAFTGAVDGKTGKFEQANGGTLFLDEIGDMNVFAQTKILQSIENKRIYPLGGQKAKTLDFRVIAATNRSPESLIADGKFREDLFYRINVARIQLPPLRNRKDDIGPLMAYAIQRLNRRFGLEVEGLSDEAMALLMRYDWPGNVRELLNLLEATFINQPGKLIRRGDLPPGALGRVESNAMHDRDERRAIVSALLATNWNKSSAAHKLQWSRMTLYRKISKYGITEPRLASAGRG